MSKVKTSIILSTLLLSVSAMTQVCSANAPVGSEVPINYQLINENGLVERQANKLKISWKGMPAQGQVAVKWQDFASGNEGTVNAQVNQGTVTIDDPNPNRRTIFKLPSDQNKVVTLAERKVPAPGMDNLRDLGGFKTVDGRYTRWGLAYRADTLYKAKPDGYRYLTNMNMGYVFDLRNEGEVARKPDPAMDGVRYFHTQIPDSPPGYEDVSWDTNEDIFKFVSSPRAETFYIDTNAFMVDAPKSHDSMKKVFDSALNADGKALVWHCAGGKDRTGYVSAIFLAALGVPEETIVNEYLLTNEYRKEFDKQELADMGKAFNNHPAAMKGFLAIQQSRPDYILAGLKRIEQQYGSMNNYLEKEIGLTKEQIAKLKQMYTE